MKNQYINKNKILRTQTVLRGRLINLPLSNVGFGFLILFCSTTINVILLLMLLLIEKQSFIKHILIIFLLLLTKITLLFKFFGKWLIFFCYIHSHFYLLAINSLFYSILSSLFPLFFFTLSYFTSSLNPEIRFYNFMNLGWDSLLPFSIAYSLFISLIFSLS